MVDSPLFVYKAEVIFFTETGTQAKEILGNIPAWRGSRLLPPKGGIGKDPIVETPNGSIWQRLYIGVCRHGFRTPISRMRLVSGKRMITLAKTNERAYRDIVGDSFVGRTLKRISRDDLIPRTRGYQKGTFIQPWAVNELFVLVRLNWVFSRKRMGEKLVYKYIDPYKTDLNSTKFLTLLFLMLCGISRVFRTRDRSKEEINGQDESNLKRRNNPLRAVMEAFFCFTHEEDEPVTRKTHEERTHLKKKKHSQPGIRRVDKGKTLGVLHVILILGMEKVKYEKQSKPDKIAPPQSFSQYHKEMGKCGTLGALNRKFLPDNILEGILNRTKLPPRPHLRLDPYESDSGCTVWKLVYFDRISLSVRFRGKLSLNRFSTCDSATKAKPGMRAGWRRRRKATSKIICYQSLPQKGISQRKRFISEYIGRIKGDLDPYKSDSGCAISQKLRQRTSSVRGRIPNPRRATDIRVNGNNDRRGHWKWQSKEIGKSLVVWQIILGGLYVKWFARNKFIPPQSFTPYRKEVGTCRLTNALDRKLLGKYTKALITNLNLRTDPYEPESVRTISKKKTQGRIPNPRHVCFDLFATDPKAKADNDDRRGLLQLHCTNWYARLVCYCCCVCSIVILHGQHLCIPYGTVRFCIMNILSSVMHWYVSNNQGERVCDVCVNKERERHVIVRITRLARGSQLLLMTECDGIPWVYWSRRAGSHVTMVTKTAAPFNQGICLTSLAGGVACGCTAPLWYLVHGKMSTETELQSKTGLKRVESPSLVRERGKRQGRRNTSMPHWRCVPHWQRKQKVRQGRQQTEAGDRSDRSDKDYRSDKYHNSNHVNITMRMRQNQRKIIEMYWLKVKLTQTDRYWTVWTWNQLNRKKSQMNNEEGNVKTMNKKERRYGRIFCRTGEAKKPGPPAWKREEEKSDWERLNELNEENNKQLKEYEKENKILREWLETMGVEMRKMIRIIEIRKDKRQEREYYKEKEERQERKYRTEREQEKNRSKTIKKKEAKKKRQEEKEIRKRKEEEGNIWLVLKNVKEQEWCEIDEWQAESWKSWLEERKTDNTNRKKKRKHKENKRKKLRIRKKKRKREKKNKGSEIEEKEKQMRERKNEEKKIQEVRGNLRDITNVCACVLINIMGEILIGKSSCSTGWLWMGIVIWGILMGSEWVMKMNRKENKERKKGATRRWIQSRKIWNRGNKRFKLYKNKERRWACVKKMSNKKEIEEEKRKRKRKKEKRKIQREKKKVKERERTRLGIIKEFEKLTTKDKNWKRKIKKKEKKLREEVEGRKEMCLSELSDPVGACRSMSELVGSCRTLPE